MALVDLTSRRASQRITEMVDEMLAAYVDWRETAAKSKVAYGRWSQSPAPDRELRFATFVAALDQEQSAAANYAGKCIPDRFRRSSRRSRRGLPCSRPAPRAL
jgi:hypothetical protein